jgi:hypothetical protein
MRIMVAAHRCWRSRTSTHRRRHPSIPKPEQPKAAAKAKAKHHLRRRQHSLPFSTTSHNHLPQSPDSKVMPWTRSRAATDTASTIPHCGMLSRIQSTVIAEELARRNPALLAELRSIQEPTVDQRGAVEDLLADALSENWGPGHVPNEHGLAIERAINRFLEVWPIRR